MKRLLVALALVAFALPASAAAGGWATVQLSSTPKGMRAGTPWNVTVTVLQHGKTPLADVKPTITIRNGTRTLVFRTRPTSEIGEYRGRVVFPRPGVWHYSVYDAFTAYGGATVHNFAAVRIKPLLVQ
jgi:hypothetical protein